MCCLIAGEIKGAPNGLMASSPLPSALMDKLLQPALPIRQARCNSYLSLNSTFQFPARPQNYINKPIVVNQEGLPS